MVSAVWTCSSVKWRVRRTGGRVIPAAPMRYSAAGLFAYRSAGRPPGTGSEGASGTTVLLIAPVGLPAGGT